MNNNSFPCESIYDVSVIIPTYNRAKLLDLTLSSLFNQKNNLFSFEVIIVNDGSTDNTNDIIDKYSVYENLRVVNIKHDKFRVAFVRNEGIKVAQGEVIIFLDTGIIVNSDFIYEHAKWHFMLERKIAIIGFVYGVLNTEQDQYLNEIIERNNFEDSFKELANTKMYDDVREIDYIDFDYNLEKMPAPWVFFWTCNVSMKRSNVIDVGNFDESFNSWGGEDIEIGYRLYKNNTIFMFSRGAEAIHYPHSRNHAINLESNQDNTLYIYRKHKDIMIEFLYYGGGPGFNTQLYHLLISEKKRIDYRLYLDKELFSLLTNKMKNYKNIVFGSNNEFLLTLLDCQYGFEYNTSKARQIREKTDNIIIYNNLGAIVSPNDNLFDNALVTEFINLIYQKNWIIKLLESITQVCQKTYIFIEFCYDNNVIYSYAPELIQNVVKENLNKSSIIEILETKKTILKLLVIF